MDRPIEISWDSEPLLRPNTYEFPYASGYCIIVIINIYWAGSTAAWYAQATRVPPTTDINTYRGRLLGIIHGRKYSRFSRILEWSRMYLSQNLTGVNPVVMNYKIRHDKIGLRRGQRGIVLRDQTTFPLLFVVAEKRKNIVWTWEATCKGTHRGRLVKGVS